MSCERCFEGAGGDIPQTHFVVVSPILTTTGKHGAIRTENYTSDPPSMLPECCFEGAGGNIPQTHRLVRTTTGDYRAIRTEGYTINITDTAREMREKLFMSYEYSFEGASSDIPQAHLFPTTTGKGSPVRTECETTNIVFMPYKGGFERPSPHIP